MHEMGIAQSLVAILEEEMERHSARSLRSARLRVGRFAVVPELLAFAFETVTAGTRLEGAKLLIDVPPVVARCSPCEKEFNVEGHDVTCPSCGSKETELLGGQELFLVEVEIG